MTRSRKLTVAIVTLAVIGGLLVLRATKPSGSTDVPAPGVDETVPAASELDAIPLDAPAARESLVLASTPDNTGPTHPSPDVERPAPARASLTVRVSWEADDSPGANIAARLSYDSGPEFGKRVQLGVTGLDGVLQVGDLSIGRATVYVDRGLSRDIDLEAGRTTVAELALPPGIDTDVLVFGPSGNPVPAAQVWLMGGSGRARHLMGSTDPTGLLRCRGLRSNDALVAYHASYGPSRSARVCVNPRPCITRLVLAAGVSVTLAGRVTGVAGEPVADALVMITTSRDTASSTPARPDLGSISAIELSTDRAGDFASPPIGSGIHEIRVVAKHYLPAELRIDDEQRAPGPIGIPLDSGVQIEGTVRDDDGNSCAGAFVKAGESVAKSDSSGRYLLTGAHRKFQVLRASHPTAGKAEFVLLSGAAAGQELEDILADIGIADQRVVELDPQQTIHQDIALSRGAIIRGRVALEDGAPLGGWTVGVGVEPRKRGGLEQSVFTAEDGSFTLINCRPEGNRLEIHTRDPAHNSLVKEIADVRPDGPFLTIRVSADELPTAVITGRIVGLAEMPTQPRLYFAFVPEPRWKWPVKYTADGSFEIGPLVPGEYRVMLSCKEGASTDLAKVSLSAGQTVDLGPVSCR